MEALESINGHIKNRWTESAKLCTFLSRAGIFEPVHYIIHVEWFSPSSAIQIIQFFYILLNL